MILNETKSMNMLSIKEMWPRATVETIPAVQNSWGAAPRAGVAMLIKWSLKHAVTHIYNEWEETNWLIRAITIDIEEGRRIIGTYVSPNASRTALTKLITYMVTHSTGYRTGMDRRRPKCERQKMGYHRKRQGKSTTQEAGRNAIQSAGPAATDLPRTIQTRVQYTGVVKLGWRVTFGKW